MQAFSLPAIRGWYWIVNGFSLFKKNPVLLALLVLGYWLAMLVVRAIPSFGLFISFLVTPAFSVGVMNAFRHIDTGIPVRKPMLFSGFHHQLQDLIKVGAVYLLYSLAVLGVFLLLDDGSTLKLLTQPDALSDVNENQINWLPVIGSAIALLPFQMANWFAPILIAWHDVPMARALFFSFVACCRNWRPLLVYFLCIAIILPSLLLPLAGNGESASMASLLSAFVLMGIVFPTLQASFYVSYREIFSVHIEADA